MLMLEQFTGSYWIDGKRRYMKTINIGHCQTIMLKQYRTALIKLIDLLMSLVLQVHHLRHCPIPNVNPWSLGESIICYPYNW